jgi:hypothetical protein
MSDRDSSFLPPGLPLLSLAKIHFRIYFVLGRVFLRV